MRLFIASLAIMALVGAQPAAAQRPAAARAAQDPARRLALASRPAAGAAAARPARLACAPLGGQVFDPNGQPLAGATLLVQGTHTVYVTDSEGKFQLTEPVYQGQVLNVQAAGFATLDVPLADCALPRLVLARDADARIRRSGKRAGQVLRIGRGAPL